MRTLAIAALAVALFALADLAGSPAAPNTALLAAAAAGVLGIGWLLLGGVVPKHARPPVRTECRDCKQAPACPHALEN